MILLPLDIRLEIHYYENYRVNNYFLRRLDRSSSIYSCLESYLEI
jgi:hypothetical protein